jgi:predicted glycosyltransferase
MSVHRKERQATTTSQCTKSMNKDAGSGNQSMPPRSNNPRVLLYSHDTFGLGHLRRNLAIAAHLLRRRQPFSVLLLTGSPVAASWPMPVGLQVQALPPVVKTGAEKYASLDTSYSFATTKARREAVILESIIRYRPDVLLVDHAPAGMKGELLEALVFIRERMPATRNVVGLRDIIDSPQAVLSLWHEQNIYQLLQAAYDQVFVYGSRHLFDSVSEYHFPPAVAAKTRYCGYIAHNGRDVAVARHLHAAPAASGPPVILITAGGGGDGYPLLAAYLHALDRVSHDAAQSIMVTGPLMATEKRHALELAAAQRRDVRIIPFTTELEELIRRADLVVAMAGYNTTVEILAAKKRAILVPRAAPRMEQRLRAALLSNMGLASVVQPEEDLTARLAELIQHALAGARLPRNDSNAVDLGGVHRVGDLLAELVGIATAT